MTDFPRIPKQGRPHDEILEEMKAFGSDDIAYKEGKAFSLVYYLGEAHEEFLKEAYATYMSSNALNPMAFRSLKRFESEVVAMTASMLNGDENTVGVMTSGGTESCLLAVYTAREKAKAQRFLPFKPEMIVPESVHVAFEKAAHYFGIKVVHAPLDENFRVDVKAVKKRINRNTILIVASAPPYPHGVVDPIEELGKLAASKGIPLHVDACLGGFLLPWVERLGYDVPTFDFRVPGVMSISADIHKYGYAAKGASLILFRNMDYMKHLFFVYTDWPGGIYASPGILGTRPGGAIAAAWATLQAIGEEGYLEYTKKLMQTAEKIKRAIESIEELELLGSPHAAIFSFRSTNKDLSIYAVGDQMEKKGWHLDRNQRPEALHCMLTPLHTEGIEQFIEDLRDSVKIVLAHPELGSQGGAATYGMIANIPLRGMIKKNVLKMMQEMYRPNGSPPRLEEPEDDLATRLGLLFLDAKKKILDKLQR